jgi:hypothetical protein
LESGPSTGSYSIDFLRIYRTNTGTTGTEYQLVVELDHAAGSFIDTVANSDLQEVLPSASWAPPPPDMRGLISLPSGSLAGFSGKVYCESMPYLPHAWPASYQVPVDAPIIMIGSYGNNVLVVTEGQPYVMTGQAGSRMTEKLEIGYACVSKRGFVDMGYACIYPAVNGLMLVGMGDVRLVSANLLTQKDWEAFNPETIHAYLWDGKYVAFWTNSSGYEGFIFDPATQDLTLHSVPATAGYTEPATGKLFICSEGEIKEWDGNISYLTATWKSKEYILPNPLSPSCGQVFASAYPVTFKLYLDGVLHYTRSVANSKPFRVLGGKLATKCSVEIESNTTISQVLLSDSMAELARV